MALIVVPFSAYGQSGESMFTVWTGQRERSSFADITNAAIDADVVLVGEAHDDSIGHIVELKILAAVADRVAGDSLSRPVVLSLEMFARDVQTVVDEYLAGAITEKHFREAARPWKNYDPDYRRMVEFARQRGLPVLAANTPRRYVNMVSRGGRAALDSLGYQSRQWLPPIPFAAASDAYSEKWNEMIMAAVHHTPADTPADTSAAEEHGAVAEDEASQPHDTEAADTVMAHSHAGLAHMLDAQSLWDAGMAHSMALQLMKQASSLIIHYVGSFHMTRDSGIQDHLRAYRPGTRTVSVLIEPVADIESFDAELQGEADYVVLTPKPKDDAHAGR